MEELYQKYQDQGLRVLAFPSGDFGGQEFDDPQEILAFARDTYQVTFPLFEKSSVKAGGDNPLFPWLTQHKGGLLTRELKWNFTKFLVDRQGRVRYRFSPQKPPEKLEKAIQELLAEEPAA